jgi:hypothetical protein
MADMPARRAHELSRLDNVVFNFERRNDLHRSRPHLFVEMFDIHRQDQAKINWRK